MLELVDLDQRISKADFDAVFPALEARLGEYQRAARASGIPVVLVFEGWDAAGKGTLINRLALALDPRGFKVHSGASLEESQALRPWLWPYWNELPAAGAIAIFDRSWYRRLLECRVEGAAAGCRDQPQYEDVLEFERQLTDSGTVLLKFWLHIDKREQKRRLWALAKDPDTAWRVGKRERRQHRHYAQWLAAVEEMLQRTSTPYAPWTIVEATQERFARLRVFETVVGAVERELARRATAAQPVKGPVPAHPCPTPRQTVLDRVNLGLHLDRPEYERQLDRLQKRLFELEHRLYIQRVPAVIVFEGWDAAGKGGAIRRLAAALDPRGYEVIPIASPTPEEQAHHYLWRFWRRVPKAGHIAIFDRSWYGRVLVERVEGFCSEDQWRRAYQEINEFERQLAEFGTAIVKFWLHIDADEQLRRFEARQREKQWKIGDEDWRNRQKWKQYELAVTEMLERTSTTYAPWTVVEANDKLFARIKVLRTVADTLAARLRGQ